LVSPRVFTTTSALKRAAKRDNIRVQSKSRVTKEGVSSLRQRSREKKSVGDRDDFFAFSFLDKIGEDFWGKNI